MSIELSIIYDNVASKGFISGWGFATLIEKNGQRILFDTGWDGIALLKNLEQANIDPKTIEFIAISHRHWDHAGGLSTLLYETKRPMVFVPSSFSSKLKAEITKLGELRELTGREGTEIIPGIRTTPELETSDQTLTELALLIETTKGLVILTGCAHPGLEAFIKYGKKQGELYGVIGGFHGFDKLHLLKEYGLIIPCHCTQKKEEILTKYPETARECKSGLTFKLE
ncbi:MAG: MBL fold metallo-hydrolase [Candidatus Heimdallarchaeota archaeon]|nr:MBL fold metallo-hydrolase [Candidatus Heimdallarchaeota archaeon]